MHAPPQPPTRDPATFPGRLTVAPGTWADYRTLAHLHYRRGDPRCPAAVVTATFTPHAGFHGRPRVAGVAVLCYPAIRCAPRERRLGLSGGGNAEFARFVNRHVRVVSRVIVHPPFRGLGLATGLVRAAAELRLTRYTESIAVMGRLVPMFERAGFERVETAADAPAYFLHDGGAE